MAFCHFFRQETINRPRLPRVLDRRRLRFHNSNWPFFWLFNGMRKKNKKTILKMGGFLTHKFPTKIQPANQTKKTSMILSSSYHHIRLPTNHWPPLSLTNEGSQFPTSWSGSLQSRTVELHDGLGIRYSPNDSSFICSKLK